MLIKLTADQVSRSWDFLRQHIVTGTPLDAKNVENYANKMLAGFLSGELVCWVEGVIHEEATTIHAVVVTQVLRNNFLDFNNLLIYSVLGLNNYFDQKQWLTGLQTLAQYAKANNCLNVIAYTDQLTLIEIAKRLKADVSQTLVVFSL